MTADTRPCPMCSADLHTPMSIDVCGSCYQDLGSSGAVTLQSTAEFAAVSPERAAEFARARDARRRSAAGRHVACTWCGKPRGQVKKLLASGEARICNECVALCAELLESELGADWRA